MKILYTGSLSDLLTMSFDIFCFMKNDKIYENDVSLILSYLINSNSNEESYLDSIKFEKLTNSFFSDKNYLNRMEYIEKIENENSDVFLLFLILIYVDQPFNNNILKFYSEHNFNYDDFNENEQIKNNKDKLNKFNFTLQSNNIANPSTEILNLINNNFLKNTKVKRKFGSKNVLSTQEIILDQEIDSDQNFEFTMKNSNISITQLKNKKSNKNSLLTKTTANSSFSSFAINFSNLYLIDEYINLRSHNNYEEFEILKINSNQKLQKFKIKLIENNLFVYKNNNKININDNNNENFQLDLIKCLNGYFITPSEEYKIDEKNHYPLLFINKFGNSFISLNNLYFFENNYSRDDFLFKLKLVIKITDINDDYKFKNEILGKGEFGEVILANKINGNLSESFAVKKIKKSNIKSMNEIQLIKNEINILNFLKNNKNKNYNIVDIIEIYESQKFIYIVMEYINYGNLSQYIKKKEIVISLNESKEIILQLLDGLNFLHKNGIIHRDLKPDNILIKEINRSKNSKYFEYKISDFGFSRVIGENEQIDESIGSLIYTAPEILLNIPYNKKVDSWSLGVIIFYLISGNFPFENDKNSNKKSKNDLMKKIIRNELNFPQNSPFDNLGNKFKNVLNIILNKFPKDRPYVNKIKDLIVTNWK